MARAARRRGGVARGILCAARTAPRVRVADNRGDLHGRKRTTHRSSKGTKLYAVRDKKGKFKDIQSYKRAHGQDIKRKAKKEVRRKK